MASPDERIDRLLNDPERTGLTGTTPANAYAELPQDEGRTRPPDGRPMADQPAWRQDFPIDWPDDEYVSRREFSKFLVLTSLAFAVGQLWVLVRNWWARRRGEPELKRVASLSQLRVGTPLVFAYPHEHDDCVLMKLGQTEVVAYSQKCTHLSCAVVPRPEKGMFECPCHHGFFDLRTGNVISGPPPRPLSKVTLEVRGDDVYATGIEERTG